MTDAKFEKVSCGDTPLYGPRKLLMCGFSADAQSKFETVLEMAGLPDVDRAWVTAEQAEASMAALFALPAGAGAGASAGSDLPRAIIVGGIAEKQLRRLMNICGKAGMKNALWAVLTPTSEQWTLSALLAELAAERAAMARPGRKG